jgi:hypothetical protein
MADPRHNVGFFGEQNMGFMLGQQGYEFIDGPSGAGGHGITTSGFDGVAYNPRTGDLILGDNKAFKRVGNVTSATAIDPAANLQKNLKGMISRLENDPNLARPVRANVLQRLKVADQGLTTWIKGGRQGQPNLGGVRLVIFNAGGNSTGVGGKLSRAGVQFEDLNAPPQIRVPAGETEPPRFRVRGDVGEPPETPRVRVIDEGEGLGAPRVSVARSAVVGALANVGAGLALGFLQSEMKDKIKGDLSNLQQPKPDPRSTQDFFKDPKTAKAMRLVDLMGRNLKPFGDDLQQHHATVMAGSMLELMLLAASRRQSVQDRLEVVGDLRDQLRTYGEQLAVIHDNIDTALDLKDKTLKAADGADQLRRALSSAVIQDELLKMGMEYEEIIDALQNLEDFSSNARQVFMGLENLRAKVERMDSEVTTLFWQLVKVSWDIILTSAIAAANASTNGPGGQAPVSPGSQRVLAAMGPGTPWLRLSQIKERVKHTSGDFVPSVETALRELNAAGLVVTSEARGQIIEAARTRP